LDFCVAQSLMTAAMIWLQKHLRSPLVLGYGEQYLKCATFSFFTLDLNTPVMSLNNHLTVEKAYA
jgi:hypothetical protein